MKHNFVLQIFLKMSISFFSKAETCDVLSIVFQSRIFLWKNLECLVVMFVTFGDTIRISRSVSLTTHCHYESVIQT